MSCATLLESLDNLSYSFLPMGSQNQTANNQGSNVNEPSRDPNIGAMSPIRVVPESSNVNHFEWRVFLLTNIERENRSVPPLEWDNILGGAARAHTEDMVRNNFISHTGSDRSNVGQRITRAGFIWSTMAENVASGQRTPEEVVNSWMNSPGHRANILNPALTRLGVGFVSNKWTQKFGTLR